MSTFCYVIFMIFANSNISHLNALFAPSQTLFDEMFFYLLFVVFCSVDVSTCDLTTVGDIL